LTTRDQPFFLEKECLTQKDQCAVALIPDCGLRQIQLVSDLPDAQALEEMEPEDLFAGGWQQLDKVPDLRHPPIPFELGLARIMIFAVYQLLLHRAPDALTPLPPEVPDRFVLCDHKQERIDLAWFFYARPVIIQFDKGVGNNVFHHIPLIDIVADDQT
jgi:hypothetical protein